MVRSAQNIAALGAAGEWLPSMQERAHAVLEEWNADLVIAGRVKKAGEVLNLWMVPRLGEGTLDRGDRPYRLEDVTLGEDFQVGLQTQLVAMALAAVIPLAYNEERSRVLQEELGESTEKLARLLNGDTINKPRLSVILSMTWKWMTRTARYGEVGAAFTQAMAAKT